jgi:colanic acid biosynthesis glycosyl transferase WcaI
VKILLYSISFAPDPTGVGKYSGEMARWLVEQGHEVRVICAPPYYPNWKLAEGYEAPVYRREDWRGVDVWRAPLWVPRELSGRSRLLHLLSFAVTSFPVAMAQIFWKPDVVVCVAPALVNAPAAWVVARLSGAKAWLHVQDFEVDVAFSLGLLTGRWARSLVCRMESLLMRRFDVVSSISSPMLESLRTKKVAPGKIRSFVNWVDISQVQVLQRASAYREELGLSDMARVVLFSGTLGGKQGLDVIPRAARLLIERKDILFVIGGEGVVKQDLQQACEGLPNVRFMPLQPAERLGEWLGLADVHLLTQSPEAADLVLPSKLTGMLASGRPVIATCRQGTELARVVSDCGVVTPPEDARALAAAICGLIDAPEQSRALGGQGRRYAEENLSKEGVLRQFEEDCADLLPELTVSRARH